MKKEEIEQVFENLKIATLAMFDVSQREDAIKQEKIAVSNKLRLAREEANSISFNS